MQAVAPTRVGARRVAAPKRSCAARAAAVEKITKAKVPLELEEGDMPMNTWKPKQPFKGKIKSVKRIVGPKARALRAHLPANRSNSEFCVSFCALLRPKAVPLQATGETCDIVIETDGKAPFWEGQSYGVIPPGTKINSRGKEMPHGTRLYSIASSRYGDDFDGQTTTLCVRRATYWDSELGKEDPAKKGICSNFLCDAEPGTEVTITGPTGKVRAAGRCF